ncbi:hypothetical protein [Pandoraea apista]|uniref:hypothetical protein n=1 Tax=Pandoraea apista TaxID=93218 RepID=UPI00248F1C03|nr:hypothetical protein [Pandoraea apista]
MKRLGEPVLAEYAHALGYVPNEIQLTKVLRGTSVHANPLHAIFLLVAMNGNWDSVESLILDSDAAASFISPSFRPSHDHLHPYPRKPKPHQAEIRCALESYVRVMRQDPSLKHLEIKAKVPVDVRHVLTIPLLKANGIDAPVAPSLKRQAEAADKDEQAEMKVRNKAQAMRRANVHYRISVGRLLQGILTVSNRQGANAKRYGRALAAARELSESPSDCKRRLLVHLATAGKLLSQNAEINTIETMSNQEILHLWRLERFHLTKRRKNENS